MVENTTLKFQNAMNNQYIVATIKKWNTDQFNKKVCNFPGEWNLITSPEELTIENLEKINPRYIFFPHWSWIVPNEVLKRWECVCFHMADVPYGRGGSPLQNLIVRGHKKTKLSALKMIDELDAGPVYKKIPLDLSGSAQEIFERMAPEIFDLINYIVTEEPTPEAQSGIATVFKRRTKDQSKLPESATLEVLYDHIRMLDAETYPKAFIQYGSVRLEFDKAKIDATGELTARVKFIEKF
ncbi:formyltransferase family protein [Endozoicomonas sp. SCSIO W0465]|uniref:formyltransferase family protein n=1 Tax=Endozoicomonas sp. SCSIO W0465 TaxID=2918516 RepID=UPI00207598D9|nr:formyltransferase family protein [Endozoicomonas sp. SCSIO W0465]USE39412.1 hypothetical protein MJO57_15345 [Endozoicomonas sp. SCSIO W0465]